jgi:hypothetical protein
MPQASTALRARMKERFGSEVDDVKPWAWLKSQGFTEHRFLIFPPRPDYHPTSDEIECVQFMLDEWDWGYALGKIMTANQQQDWFRAESVMYGKTDPLYLASKLSTEAGEVLDKLCKLIRDTLESSKPEDILAYLKANPDFRKALAVELSDTRWYVMILSKLLEYTDDDLWFLQRDKIAGRKSRGTQPGSGDER